MDIQAFVEETQRQLNSIKRRLNILSAGGQANTASNIGAGGVGLYQQKVGVDLQFRNINAVSARISVALDVGNNEVDIDVVEAQVTHNNLNGLQGGQANQYYHLTAAEHGFVSGVNAQSLLTTATPTFNDLTISVPVNIYALSHDAFADFVANEHIDWTPQIDQDSKVVKTPIKARAYLSAQQNNIANLTYTTITMAAENYDIGGNYNVGTYRFTAPVAGYYMIAFQVRWVSIVADKRYNAGIFKNSGGSPTYANSIIYNSQQSSINDYLTNAASGIQFLAQNDYIELAVYHGAGVGTVDVYFGPQSTFMAVHLLSI